MTEILSARTAACCVKGHHSTEDASAAAPCASGGAAAALTFAQRRLPEGGLALSGWPPSRGRGGGAATRAHLEPLQPLRMLLKDQGQEPVKLRGAFLQPPTQLAVHSPAALAALAAAARGRALREPQHGAAPAQVTDQRVGVAQPLALHQRH
jgi:hypothetical protein